MAHVYHSVPKYIGHLWYTLQNPLLGSTSLSSHCCANQQYEGFEKLCTGTIASVVVLHISHILP